MSEQIGVIARNFSEPLISEIDTEILRRIEARALLAGT